LDPHLTGHKLIPNSRRVVSEGAVSIDVLERDARIFAGGD
jgi:hypothetical protein